MEGIANRTAEFRNQEKSGKPRKFWGNLRKISVHLGKIRKKLEKFKTSFGKFWEIWGEIQGNWEQICWNFGGNLGKTGEEFGGNLNLMYLIDDLNIYLCFSFTPYVALGGKR